MNKILVSFLLAISFAACGSEDTTDDLAQNTQSPTQASDATPSGSTADDGICNGDETPLSNPADCPDVAGDGLCSGNETPLNVPSDCPTRAGDGFCSGSENAQSSPSDCPTRSGDGFCTGNETPLNSPADCPTGSGDGFCSGNETPLNSPADCPDVAGDALCSGNETPMSTPVDCPTVVGDGFCSGNEDAQNTPVDCPTIDGDGLCTGDENPGSNPGDCPPPNVTFGGGDLADLSAHSPSLIFGDLTITGTLRLSTFPSSVVLNLRTFHLTTGAKINFGYSTCEYSDAPNLTINAAGAVTIDGQIDLSGRSGKRVLLNATCSECNGTDGGDISIVGETITVSRWITSNGGQGSNSTITGGTQLYRMGCRAGDAGDIMLNAITQIDLGDNRLRNNGGSGGFSSQGWTPGADGVDGATAVEAPVVKIIEEESNGRVSSAQEIPLANFVVAGEVSVGDDATQTAVDVIRVTWSNGIVDRIEDLYTVTNDTVSPQSLNLKLLAASPAADLELFVFEYFASTGATTDIGFSAGPTGYENLNITVPAGKTYTIGVSWYSGLPTSYTLSRSP